MRTTATESPPDCEKSPYQVVERPKQRSSHKERPSYLRKEGILRATKVPYGVVLLYASVFIMSYEQVISFDSLYKGLKKCCKNIRWKDSTVGYEGNALKNTYRLRQSLLNGKYRIDKYQHFTIYEPKQREIVATRIKDRQFQRSLCDNGFYEQITKSFIADN